MNLYDTMTLLGMIDALDRPRRFIFDTFFSTATITFETEEILFDKITASRRIAPFVSPLIAGKAQTVRGATARSFRPAYVKPKAAVNPSAALKRRPGERIGGEMSAADRLDRILLQELEDQDMQIMRREELMAIEIVRTGKLVVESPEFPKMEIDFGRPNGHTVPLAGASRWGETDVSPLADIRAWAQTVHNASGAHPGKVVFDPLAAELFLKDEDLRKILDNRRQVDGSMQLAGAVTGGQGVEALYLGTIGQFEFWQYQQTYKDDAGATQKMMPDYTVLMGSIGIEGYACYGAIQDVAALQAMERFPKMWEEKDPSVAMVMTQSAPLPVPARVESSFCATVR
ncbi:major capsid protein [Reyranella sp.]|uniref:major capsid protein n=1 Tax=Reyranella sp. TaxID=1929291 RepID=UPI003BAB8BDA